MTTRLHSYYDDLELSAISKLNLAAQAHGYDDAYEQAEALIAAKQYPAHPDAKTAAIEAVRAALREGEPVSKIVASGAF